GGGGVEVGVEAGRWILGVGGSGADDAELDVGAADRCAGGVDDAADEGAAARGGERAEVGGAAGADLDALIREVDGVAPGECDVVAAGRNVLEVECAVVVGCDAGQRDLNRDVREGSARGVEEAADEPAI